ncbi:NmrA family NAD(P)-binding protein [Streptomyces misionensis]|uniref:NmrA family NAD(P)-binding protein n=1 Tax=Streptomyces misionensis TaxID=67331 RepID=UPI00339F215E
MGMPTEGGHSDDARPILVTGATGRHGGTGGHVVNDLLARGLRVRALVRTHDERAERLTALGAHVVVGDFADYDSLIGALGGVRAAYFCYPMGPGIAEAAGLFAGAARETGLPWLVDLSLAASDPRSLSPQGRAQWVAEKAFEWAGIEGVHLRIEAFFLENLLQVHGRQIRENSVIRNAFGDFPVGWITGADVGAMAAALLADRMLVDERTYIAGPTVRMTYGQIADTITEVTGYRVIYQEITADQWRDEMIADAAAQGRANPRGAAHLAAQAMSLRAKPQAAVRDDVTRLTGKPPTALADFITDSSRQLTGHP